LLIAHAIENAKREGAHEFDFLRGGAHDKRSGARQNATCIRAI
jgi:CelD/BcsL family acetyltransferase involved in cellulose biosynthesis